MAYSIASAGAQSITGVLGAAINFPFTLACRARTPSTTASNRAIRITASSGAAHYISLEGADQTRPAAVSRTAAGLFHTAYAATYSANVWHSLCGVFLSSSSRVCWFDGVAGSANTSSADSTTFDQILFGSATGASDILLSDCAIWAVNLSEAEIASHSSGFKPPRIRPQSLVFYAPLLRNAQDIRRGITLTNSNSATVANHPRVY